MAENETVWRFRNDPADISHIKTGISMKTRRFKEGVCNHIYQRTINRFNIFYDLCDYLSYYTIFGMAAMKFDVVIWGLCLMIDHIHMLVSAEDKKTLSDFISGVTSTFVRQYNTDIGRTGPLFEERFGSAPKAERKRLISAIIYLANNPVEKRICKRAEEYRWNFIAHMASSHPFSEKVVKKNARSKMRKALRIVDWYRTQGKHMNSKVIHDMMLGMSSAEKSQLADYIITKYNVIAYEKLQKTFGSYEQMLTAIHSTTGNEYDLDEHRDKLPDSAYRDIIGYLRYSFGGKVRKVTVCTPQEKLELAHLLRLHTAVPLVQIFKFLHLKGLK